MKLILVSLSVSPCICGSRCCGAVVDVLPAGEEGLAVELQLEDGRLEEAGLVDEERDPDDHADGEELLHDAALRPEVEQPHPLRLALLILFVPIQ